MGQMRWDDVNFGRRPEGNEGNAMIGYFSIKNPEETAFIRFMENTPEDLDVVSVHEESMTGDPSDWKSIKNISCLRGVGDSTSTCPLCARGDMIRQKVFFKLLKYEQGQNGEVVITPLIWERSTKFAQRVVNLMSEYGNLSERVFKVKRVGSGMDTTYEFFVCDSSKYPESVFKKDFSGFEGYQTIGSKVQNRTFEELKNFVDYGTFNTNQVTNNSQGFNFPMDDDDDIPKWGVESATKEAVPFDSQQGQKMMDQQNKFDWSKEITPIERPRRY